MFSTKADTLVWLKNRLKKSSIEDIYVFTVNEWQRYPRTVLARIDKRFSPAKIIIRSSSVVEDTAKDSKAGCFYSQLGVDSNITDSVSSAISRVIQSYKDLDAHFSKNQIMVQPYLESVSVSGVVFTRQLGTNSPYYCINYDDVSGKTDTVTAGRAGSLLCIFRHADIKKSNRWYKLLTAVKEIEEFFPDQPLDIEFAITKNGKIVIFQVRPLAANHGIPMPDDAHIKDLIESMKAKFRRFSKRVPHLAGGRTIFGDMPDWNPAEIIGSRPNTLDYTLYSFLFMDHAWHEARTSLGYMDVFPGELMTSFGKRPYIDTRLSFNSFTARDISEPLREKLITYYLDKLQSHPERQDKVEFEVLWTCYDFSLIESVKALQAYGFSKKEIDILVTSMRGLTNRILEDSQKIFAADIEATAMLTYRKDKIIKAINKANTSAWDLFTDAYNMLQNCKKFGALPFARLARLAFVGKSILISMKKEGIISDESYHSILNSVETVASRFNQDLNLMNTGKMSEAEFFEKYGHLRPGTYDITAPRYDSLQGLFKKQRPKGCENGLNNEAKKYVLPAKELRSIDKAMKRHCLHGDSASLLNFIKRSIEYREYSKFEFTKTLSAALEIIARGGTLLGFSRSDLSDIDITTIMKFRNPEYSDIGYAKKVLYQSRSRHNDEKRWSSLLILPSVIFSESDFEYIVSYESRPNFITDKTAQAPVMPFDRKKFLREHKLNKFIVMLENADPGYDWIFTKEPLGIITKYGGVASHMAIRCAEFGIPAAIGCGEAIYEDLVRSEAVLIDCAKKVLKPLSI